MFHLFLKLRCEVKKEIEELESLLAGAAQTSQSTLLLKKRKEMREVDESLEVMKSDYKKRMDECEERRLLFEIKQAKMREQVQKFEKFISENDAKRARAENKAKNEKKLYEDKCQILQNLADQIVEMEKEQNLLHQELVRKSCYKEYLERIIEEGEYGYEEVTDILGRYKTLKDANRDLMKVSDEQDENVNDLRKRLQDLKTDTQNKLLVNNSLFQENQKDLEIKRSKVKIEEEEKARVEDKKKDLSREFSQVTLAIKNIFLRCQTSMKNKVVFVGTKESSGLGEMLSFELDVIQCRIVDLMEISDEYHHYVGSRTDALPVIELRDASTATPCLAAPPTLSSVRSGSSRQFAPPLRT